LPNSNLFTHRMLFSGEKSLVKSTAPGSLLHHIFFQDLFLFAFVFRSIKPKTQKYFAAIFHRRFHLSSYRQGIDNPLFALGCEDLLFVCRCCLLGVGWFSFWFDNLGFIIEGSTSPLCCIIPSSSGKPPTRARAKEGFRAPLLGKIHKPSLSHAHLMHPREGAWRQPCSPRPSSDVKFSKNFQNFKICLEFQFFYFFKSSELQNLFKFSKKFRISKF
jgi:hypothetical protein